MDIPVLKDTDELILTVAQLKEYKDIVIKETREGKYD